jgi:hypothetical protein
VIDLDNELSPGEEAMLLIVASPRTMERYLSCHRAFLLAAKIFDGFNLPWWGAVPVIGNRPWNAYGRLHRVVRYLYLRRQEILLRGE